MVVDQSTEKGVPSAELSAEEAAQLEAEAEALPSAVRPRLRDVWQLPLLVGSLGLLALSLFLLMNSRPPNEYAEMLQSASEAVDRRAHDDGLATLGLMEPHLADLTPLEQARFHQIRADLFYLKQMIDGGELDANLKQVVREYRASEEMGLPLEPEQLFRMTDALISLARVKTALDYFAKLPATDSARRHLILKRLVERNLVAQRKDYPRTYDLLAELTNEPDLSHRDRVWVEARTAELRMEQGFIDEAINGLLVSIQQLKADGIGELAELFVLLGRGYFEIGDYGSAREHLTYAQELFPPADSRRGEALLYLGRIAQAEGDWDDALSLLDLVVTDFPGTRAFLPARLGRAEVYARTGRYSAAIDDFNQVVSALVRQRQRHPGEYSLLPTQTVETLITLHDRTRSQGRLDLGLRYLKLAERLFLEDPDAMPDKLLLRLAQTHQAMGAETIAEAIESALAQDQSAHAELATINNDFMVQANAPDRLRSDEVRLDPATTHEARRYYVAAGNYYRVRARQLQVDSPEETVASLGQAADAFDQGGDLASAVESLQEFIRLTSNDPRQVEGIFKLARVYQALADMAGAIGEFKRLIQAHPKTLEAHRSYVYLAQAHLQDDVEPNPAEAERLLRYVVSGEAGLTPEAPEYAEALVELGSLYASAKEYGLPLEPASYYPKAIRRLTEVIERYPNYPKLTTVYYRLGHAYRLNGSVIRAELKLEMPEVERRRLRQLQAEQMKQALAAYKAAIDGYERIAAHKRTRAEDQNLKYARMWRADSAFEVGDFESAISMYDEVVERYEDDYIALVAMIQILNTYAELGDYGAARAAQNRARRQLSLMPAQAFDEGLLGKEAWERWLKWERVLGDQEMTAAPANG